MYWRTSGLALFYYSFSSVKLRGTTRGPIYALVLTEKGETRKTGTGASSRSPKIPCELAARENFFCKCSKRDNMADDGKCTSSFT